MKLRPSQLKFIADGEAALPQLSPAEAAKVERKLQQVRKGYGSVALGTFEEYLAWFRKYDGRLDTENEPCDYCGRSPSTSQGHGCMACKTCLDGWFCEDCGSSKGAEHRCAPPQSPESFWAGELDDMFADNVMYNLPQFVAFLEEDCDVAVLLKELKQRISE